MPDVIRIGVGANDPPRGGGKKLAAGVVLIRCVLIFGAACLIWKFLSIPAGRAKLHGSILTGLSFLFTLQEFLFFQTRARLGEPLKSLAIASENLGEMLLRCQRLKAYLDRVWVWALGSKIAGLVAGPLLFFGVLSAISFQFLGQVRSADVIVAVLGWCAVLNGAYLTLRTFRVYRHIDRVLAQLEVEARQITTRREAANALRTAPVEDWTNDPSLSGYKRPPKPKK